MKNISNLIFASVLLLVALGGCFAERSGVINIGLEGIMVVGALGGALVMKFLPVSVGAPVMVLTTILTSALFGLVFSLLLIMLMNVGILLGILCCFDVLSFSGYLHDFTVCATNLLTMVRELSSWLWAVL